jgi:hypothetical protein
MLYLIHCKNFLNAAMCPHQHNNKKCLWNIEVWHFSSNYVICFTVFAWSLFAKRGFTLWKSQFWFECPKRA